MADTAERVVVELEARTQGYTAAVTGAGRTSDAAMSQIERSASRAESAVQSAATGMGAAVKRAANDIETGSARAANASRNLGRQISDIGVGLVGGQNPFLILSQQAPQVADALADTGGRAAKVAAFFAGPWGAALLAAGSALGVLAGKALESGQSVDSLVDKLIESAEKARAAAQAQAIFDRSLEGAAAASAKLNERLKEQNRSQLEVAQSALAMAESNRQIAIQNFQAEIVAARAAVERSRSARDAALTNSRLSPEERMGALGAAGAYERQLAEALKRLTLAQEGLANAQGAVVEARIPLLKMDAATQSDKSAAATDRHTRAVDRLTESFRRGKLSAVEYRDAVAKADRKLADTLKADSASRRTSTAETASLLFPVEGGRITSGVGSRRAPTAGASTNHAGIDVAVPIGTNVRAGASGVVVYAGRLGGYGNAVVVDYGAGTIAKYGHLSNLLTKSGDRVSAGDVIAQSGNTGRSTGPHLHYEVRTNGRVVDPRGRVRVGNQDLAVARDYAQAQREADRTQSGLERGAFNAEDLERALADRLRMLSSADVANILGREGVDWRGPSADVEEFDRYRAVEFQERERMLDALREKEERDIRTLADLYTDLFSNGVGGIWETFEREGLRAIALVLAQLTLGKSLGDSLNAASGSILGGLFGKPGMAQGGSFMIGGRGGLDRNVLSVNGSPVARVNQGERLDIVPAGLVAKGSGQTIIHAPQFNMRGAVVTRELYADMQRISNESAAAAGKAAYGQALRDAPAAMQKAQRFGG